MGSDRRQWTPGRMWVAAIVVAGLGGMAARAGGADSTSTIAATDRKAGTEPPAATARAGTGAGKDSGGAAVDGPAAPGPELEAALARWNKVDWEKLAAADPLKFVQELRRKCAETIVDFTATFYKQERIKGDLRDEEAAKMKWRAKPFSVYMKYVLGDKGREVLYVEGKNDNKLLAHAGGLLGPLVKVKLSPDSERAMKDNLRPITSAGMTNMLHSAVPQFELAQANGDLTVQYLGKMEVGGRKAYAIKRLLPKKEIYACKELVLFVDCEALVPVGADSYGWDGQLESKYRYTEFKLNVGLTDQDFDRGNKDYNL